jgi:hypothetical protein
MLLQERVKSFVGRIPSGVDAGLCHHALTTR